MNENTSRTVVWLLGLTAVLVALVVVWDALGMSRWIPTGILIAAILLIGGVAVMANADRFFGRRRVEAVREVHHGGGLPPNEVRTERVVEDTDEDRFTS